MPVPCGLDDVPQLRVLRLPAEFLPDFIAGGNENGRIAGAGGHYFGGDGVAVNLAGQVDDLLTEKPVPLPRLYTRLP